MNPSIGAMCYQTRLDEIKLPRIARSSLCQLRSGFLRLLNSYLNRLDDKIENKCPKCQTTPHDRSHLFNCDANPTSLLTIPAYGPTL